MRFARKELLALFSSIVSKSQSECALGADWGGAGASVSARSRGRRAASRRRSDLLSGVPGRTTSNNKLMKFRSAARGRIPGAFRAWDGKEPDGNLESSRRQANPAHL